VQNDVQNETQFNDEIDLREIFGVIWTGRTKIIAITAVFAIASVIFAFSVSNQYTATALLAPAQSESDLSGSLGQLGGLASLAGVDLGGGDSGEAQIAQEIMKSWSYIEGFIAENNIAVEVYAADGWNKVSNTLEINNDDYDIEKNEWLIEGETGEIGPPSSWMLFEAFNQKLSVSEDKKSGLVSVSIEYYSPLIAKQWVDMYIESINSFMQQRQVTKVSRNIEYLQEQIGKTSISEMQGVFYSIIEEQIKNKMLAEASPDYAFLVVGPSMVPEEKSKPKRALMFVSGTLVGFLLSVFLVLVLHYAQKGNSDVR
jgi:LPS O-antigen subunit length determinant protein (WzzB/FepE family)